MTHAERLSRRQAIAKALADGVSVSKLAEKFGVSQLWINAIGRSTGITLHGNKTPANTFAILKTLLGGGGVVEAAKKHGVTYQRVQQIRDKAIDGGFTELTQTKKAGA